MEKHHPPGSPGRVKRRLRSTILLALVLPLIPMRAADAQVHGVPTMSSKGPTVPVTFIVCESGYPFGACVPLPTKWYQSHDHYTEFDGYCDSVCAPPRVASQAGIDQWYEFIRNNMVVVIKNGDTGAMRDLVQPAASAAVHLRDINTTIEAQSANTSGDPAIFIPADYNWTRAWQGRTSHHYTNPAVVGEAIVGSLNRNVQRAGLWYYTYCSWVNEYCQNEYQFEGTG